VEKRVAIIEQNENLFTVVSCIEDAWLWNHEIALWMVKWLDQ